MVNTNRERRRLRNAIPAADNARFQKGEVMGTNLSPMTIG